MFNGLRSRRIFCQSIGKIAVDFCCGGHVCKKVEVLCRTESEKMQYLGNGYG